MPDLRSAFLNDFAFSTYKLRSFNNAEHAAQVENALGKLHEQLNSSHRKRVEPWLRQELQGQVVDFKEAVEAVGALG